MSTSEDPLLRIVVNLSRYHREHEKFYAESPLHDAIALQRASRALKALAERWAETAHADAEPALSPFAGARDLNDERAIETLGILFMEGEGEPAEITKLKADLTALADAADGTGTWLANAMEASWAVAEALVDHADLADLLAERHRIISNDWQSASLVTLTGRVIHRAVVLLDRVDFTPAALRADLDGPRQVPAYLFSATELLDHAADLAAQSASLVHDNERRWRIFHARVEELTGRSA
ncbi:MAG: hypothetical protein ACEQSX_19675 [Baekduiaceae bacterium]